MNNPPVKYGLGNTGSPSRSGEGAASSGAGGFRTGRPTTRTVDAARVVTPTVAQPESVAGETAPRSRKME